jgi:PAS domain S-box-containing protein
MTTMARSFHTAAAEELRRLSAKIISSWESRVRSILRETAGHGALVLLDSLSVFLKQLADDLSADQAKLHQQKANGLASSNFFNDSFNLRQVVLEYRVLREVLVLELKTDSTFNEDQTRRLHAFIDQGIQNAVDQAHPMQPSEAQHSPPQAIRFQEVFQQCPLPMVLFMGEELRCTLINDPACRILHRSFEEIQGKPLLEVFQHMKDEVSPFVRLLEGVYRSGTPYIGKELYYPTFIPNEKPAADHWIDVGYYPYFEDGKVVGVLTYNNDVTDKVQVRKQVEESDRLYKEIANAMPQIVWTATADGKIDWYNDWWHEYTGNIKNPLHPDDLESAVSLWQRCVQSGQPYEKEYRFKRHSDGQYRWHLCRALPVKDSQGNILRWVGTETDIQEQKSAEYQAHLAQQELQDFVTQSPSPMAIFLGPDHLFSVANPAYESFVGRKVVGKTVLEAFSHAEVGLFIPLLDEVYKTGIPYIGKGLPFTIPNEEGFLSENFVDVRYHPFRDHASSEIKGILVDVHDVTEQVKARKSIERSQATAIRARQKLEQSEMRFRQFSDNLQSQVLHILELEPLQISYVGPAYERVWGRSIESLYLDPMSFIDSIHEEDRPFVEKSMERQLQGEKTDISYRIIRPDGEIRWICDRTDPIFDSDGKLVRTAGIAEDITDRKNAESKLAFEKHKFETVFREAGIAMALYRGPEFIYEMLNPAYQAFFPNRELLGKKFRDAFPELVDQPATQMMTRVYETGEPYHGIEVLTRVAKVSGGPLEDRYYDYSFFAVFDSEGQPYGIYNHAMDVTEKVLSREKLKQAAEDLRIAKEEAERANSLKSAFLANMSHEIRTPLAGILGFSRILKETTLGAEDRAQFIDNIIRNGDALSRIIDDILDLAKVESGHLDVEIIEFPIRDLLTEVTDLFKEKARQKNIYLRYTVDDFVPALICSDPTRLRQILINLVGNAIKFTEQGGVRVYVQAELERTPNEYRFLITVKDSGVGLNDEQKKKLFQPFVQADNSTTRKFGGTGLGLVLSQRLAQALGGKVEILDCGQSEGCTFAVNFIARAINPQKEVPAEVPHSKHVFPNPNALKDVRVLIVDDSQDNRFLATRFLTTSGAKVETACDGREGYEKAMGGGYDLVLMDIQMPEMDGYQAKQALDEHGFEKPIVALTAHAMTDDRQRTKDAGFVGHLTKPLVPEALILMVERFTKLLH